MEWSWSTERRWCLWLRIIRLSVQILICLFAARPGVCFSVLSFLIWLYQRTCFPLSVIT